MTMTRHHWQTLWMKAVAQLYQRMFELQGGFFYLLKVFKLLRVPIDDEMVSLLQLSQHIKCFCLVSHPNTFVHKPCMTWRVKSRAINLVWWSIFAFWKEDALPAVAVGTINIIFMISVICFQVGMDISHHGGKAYLGEGDDLGQNVIAKTSAASSIDSDKSQEVLLLKSILSSYYSFVQRDISTLCYPYQSLQKENVVQNLPLENLQALVI